ncbi:hypothetical protein E4656_18655 [Natronospirillum operosum]|uniref:Periplasmic binding protein domain-containing protein n=1 Tax=Natronospirillum operosum TaxID=2759953 RepID=A0A4Z0W1T0_9GAMM|nr:substrate-binding domain-containing protein [Natronospirillum operosum]TGG90420.1 hypothetical protein E4656_18655 [Natronospirillum operosum]
MSTELIRRTLLVLLFCCGFAAAEQPRLTVIVNDLGNPYFQALSASIRATAREHLGPDASVQVMSSGYDLERQRRQIEAARGQGVDLLILTAAHPAALEADVEALRAEGTVVVAVDVATAGARLTITTHNVEAGFIACTQLAQYLNREGRIAILDGPPVSSIGERNAGCAEALQRFPRVEIVAWENSGASHLGGIEAMTRLLSREPELDGVFAINDPAALGAASALEFRGRSDIPIASVDGSPEVVMALRAGNTPLLNTAAQFPWQIGREAVLRGLALLGTVDHLEETVLIPAELIHRDNAHQFCDWRRCPED